MRSPFPGMNPYLEQEDAWRDFHNSMMTAVRSQMLASLRGKYVIKLEQMLFIHEPPAHRRMFGQADLGVTDVPKRRKSKSGGSVALMEPAMRTIPVGIDYEKHFQIHLYTHREKRLVTVIEMLSPSNKSGADRGQYLAKRGQILASSAHLVEIDCLRGGPRMPVDDLPDSDYCIVVSRAEERPLARVWNFNLPDRLPKIAIPLVAPESEFVLDLQKAFDFAFELGGYDDYIYESKPKPRLNKAQLEWATKLLKSQSSRS